MSPQPIEFVHYPETSIRLQGRPMGRGHSRGTGRNLATPRILTQCSDPRSIEDTTAVPHDLPLPVPFGGIFRAPRMDLITSVTAEPRPSDFRLRAGMAFAL